LRRNTNLSKIWIFLKSYLLKSYFFPKQKSINLTSMKTIHFFLFSITILLSYESAMDSSVFPSTVISSSRNKIYVDHLAKSSTVIVIMIKSPNCPVCQKQLIRIKNQLDTFNKCGVTFLVLSPGTQEEVQQLKIKTGFPFPFIPDSDLEITAKFGLIINEKQILPSILVLNNDLTIRWIRKGRNNFNFGDDELYDYLDCDNWI